ncbi:hypothetical protein I302_104844 [Kwoniella bestiolae CBS 10118]|uniref:PUM-HD domain-containing protein n=1 Tax=Kwoniella bestiolae CBS 10118 TaxID=1296100 RepID=A0A1B9FRL2_9TREE|nr:hypothetical protein I302_09087 [Kwoniella bestiolae CBS 10118]OCF21409.1 hypothetical protein I302_09087 [Kwoniella bestiolae CBS 10118]
MSNQHYDHSSDLAARMGGMGISGGEDNYPSPQQPSSHGQSPVNNTHGYANIQTPTSRIPSSQPYSPYGDQQGYPYYPGTTTAGGLGVGVGLDATYAATAGLAGNPTATYGFVPPTPDLMNLPTPQMSSAGYDGSFPTPTEVYGNQQDHRQSLGAAQQNPHSTSPLIPRATRQNARPPPVQSAYSTLQQHANAAAVAAGYYGFQDPRSYWIGQTPNMYMQQGNARKKDYQNNSYNNSRNQSSYSLRTDRHNVNNSHFGYNDGVTPTRGAFTATSGSSPYSLGSHNSNNAYQLSQGHGYSGLTGYAPHGYQGAAGYVLRSKRFDDSGVVRSALLEDFRLNKVRKWELKDIFGHIAEFSGDQHGSRFIQQKLETATIEDRQKLFDEIMPNAYQLMTDVFGNYVTQKLFEHGDQKQKAALAKKMEGHVLALSMQMYGCRVVQKALEHVLVDQRKTLVSELEGHVLECVRSSNANHVIQKLIILGPPQTVPDAFIGHIEELAKHPYGCRVIQKMFENLEDEMKRTLLDEMHEHTLDLMEDQFGNYVVQSVITEGAPADRDKVIEIIKGRVVSLARHKFASNVVEKAILSANDDDRKLLIDELVAVKEDGSNQVGMLLRDAFGNFPLQTALVAASAEQRQELLDLINPIIPQIRNTPVGKRLENRINQFDLDDTSTANTSDTETTPGGLTMSRSTSEETGPQSPPEIKHGLRAKSTTPKIGNGNGNRLGGKKEAKTLEDLLG